MGLPQLSLEEKASLDQEMNLEELTTAVNQLVPVRAPRIDGFSADIFKCFWNILGPNLHSVLLECLRAGPLPV